MKPRIIAVLIASLGIAGVLGSAALLQADDVQQEGQEARLILPRLANGGIDVDKLRAEIRQLLLDGVRDVRIRDLDLHAHERLQIVDLARQLSGELAWGRVRLLDEGDRLRLVLRDEQEAAEDGHEDRHRDDRADRREDVRVDRVERTERDEVGARPERQERAEGQERVERPERQERTERQERAERPERQERAERNERVERPERRERMERPERVKR